MLMCAMCPRWFAVLLVPIFLIEEAAELVTGSRRRAQGRKEQDTWDRNILVVQKKGIVS